MSVCPTCQAPLDQAGKYCGRCGTDIGEAAAWAGRRTDPWIGQVVEGRYRVAERIGQGGTGVVYRVRHVRMGKLAAMKVLARNLSSDPEGARQFHREAQAVSELDHPNIVQTFDFGLWQGCFYLVMEHVRGEDLGAAVKRDGPLPFAAAVRLFVQVCSALTEAHAAGVVHRDVKPENIMRLRRRDGSEHAKVLDFGLAKLRESENTSDVSGRGNLVGTPYYMSPEQVRSEPLDARSDMYSLGATLYRVLTGEPPFQASTPVGVLTMHLTETAVPPTHRSPHLGLPADADDIVLRAMARDREDRYQSAAEMGEALERALRGASPQPGPREPDTSLATSSDSVSLPVEPEVGVEAASGEQTDGLRREDFDAFERGLRRRRIAATMIAPLLLAGAGAAAWLLFRDAPERPRTAEHEPNDSAGTAGLVGTGAPARGRIGRANTSGPDRDFWRVPPGAIPRTVTARAESPPGLDLVVELFDGLGRPLGRADAPGAGRAEWLPPTSIGPGEHYLVVREVWMEGRAPTEDVADPYVLTVSWGKPEPGIELEPNDGENAAQSMALGSELKGHLPAATDVDWYEVGDAGAGPIKVRVQGPAGVDVAIQLPGAQALADRAGVGEGEELTIVPSGRVRFALRRKGPSGTGQQEPAGEEAAYKVEVR